MFGTVQYSLLQHFTVQYSKLSCIVHCSKINCTIVAMYSAIVLKYIAGHCSTVQFIVALYNTVIFIEEPQLKVINFKEKNIEFSFIILRWRITWNFVYSPFNIYFSGLYCWVWWVRAEIYDSEYYKFNIQERAQTNIILLYNVHFIA